MFLNKPEDIESVLVLTHLQGVPVKVKIRGIEKDYTSSFIERSSEPDHTPCLMIARLSPPGGNNLLPLSKSINIQFDLPRAESADVMTYTFNAFFIREEIFEGSPVLRITFPELRCYNRVEPAPGEAVAVTLKLENGDTQGQPLANISQGGVGFYTHFDETVLPLESRHTVSCTLPGGASVSSRGTVKWIAALSEPVHVAGTSYSHFCGIEFYNLDPSMQDAIIAYVKRREQEELRKLVNDESLWTDFR